MAEDKTTAKKAPAKKTAKAELSLPEQLSVKRADLLELQKSHAAGELINPTVLRNTRKEIARLLTAIRAESLGKKESK
jgi:ribosomal protein L29